MTAFLERLSSAPVQQDEFSFAFESWTSVLVDTLNEVIQDLENILFLKQELIAPTVALTAEVGATYIIGNDLLTTITLPSDAPQGAVVRIIGKGAAGWTLLPGATQTIEVAGSTAATSVSSSSRYDCICVEVVTTNTTWVTTSSETSGFVIV